MAQTANEELRDAATRSAVFVHRFAESEARKIVKLLNSADADLVEILRQRLEGIKSRGFDTGPATTTRLTRLLDQLRQVNTDIYQRARMTLTDDLLALAGTATESTIESLNMAVGVDLDLLSPAPSVLRSAVTSDPFQGKVMSEWFSDLSRNRINAMRQAINIGIVQGQTNDQIVRRIVGTRVQGFRDGVLNMHRNHAATVVRTAANHTNSRARDLVYEANSDVVKQVVWVSTLDGVTSAVCRALDSTVYPVGEGERPPAHPNCLPGDALVSAVQGITGATKRWFDGDLVVIRTAGGRHLACTPNHPVLTDAGWVPARSLDQHCRVVCDGCGERETSLIYGKHKDVPARIEDVAEAFFSSPQVATGPVPTTAEDFHGDGVDGEVAIVGTDSRLVAHVDAARQKHGGEAALQVRNAELSAFAGRCAPAEFVEGPALAADGVVRSFGKSTSLIRAGASHACGLLLAAPSERNVRHAQRPIDGGWADAEHIRDAADADPGLIEFDDVVSVETRKWSGHVYNLETPKGYYVADGIVTHNCRSTVVPVTRSWAELSKSGALKAGRGSTKLDTLFEQRLAAKGFTPAQIAATQRATRASMTGQVPDALTYGDWLRKQPRGFVDDVLGVDKGKLFMDGGLSMDRFVDMKSGREFTLQELRIRETDAWRAVFGG